MSDATDTARAPTKEPDPDEGIERATDEVTLPKPRNVGRTDKTNYAHSPTPTVSLLKKPWQKRAQISNNIRCNAPL